jgi:hypothetical protein
VEAVGRRLRAPGRAADVARFRRIMVFIIVRHPRSGLDRKMSRKSLEIGGNFDEALNYSALAYIRRT